MEFLIGYGVLAFVVFTFIVLNIPRQPILKATLVAVFWCPLLFYFLLRNPPWKR